MKPDKVCLSLIALLVITPTLWITSCRHDAILPSNMRQVCFQTEVLPVFLNNCAISGCHDGTREGRAYDSYANISRGVSPGNPNGSSIYQAIISKFGENKMPPSGPLPLQSRTIIRVWIEQGANQTLCAVTTIPGPAESDPSENKFPVGKSNRNQNNK